MSVVDGRVPVIVGVGQIVQRPGGTAIEDARGPVELMLDAARVASADAGAPKLLADAQFVGVAGGRFPYRDPGRLVADAVGATSAATALTAISGTGPQDLLGIAAERIARGQLDVALIVGGEASWSRERLKRDRRDPPEAWMWHPGEGVPEVVSGYPDELMAEAKMFGGAPTAYALFEDALRSANSRTVDEQRDLVSSMWAQFSAVAARNSWAWDRSVHSAEEIREPTPRNRLVAFPYTKAMVANNLVDMASAVLLCSVERARAVGVSIDRFVFPRVVTKSHETWVVAHRRELHCSPALAAAGRAALDHCGLTVDDIDHVDLYACFPSIVEMSSAALGLSIDRPLTVTGGLGFAGAAVGNAVGHSICAMVEAVRGGGLGLVHGNGGFATKHSFGVYALEPPKEFVHLDVQDLVDLDPRPPLEEGWSGPVNVDSATLVFDRAGPSHVVAGCLTGNGARAWARTGDPSWFSVVTSGSATGMSAHVTASGELVV